MIGETVSHYHIREKIGAGGMGVVYRADDLTLGRTVAIKFLPRELSYDDVARGRFIQEAKSASQLDHPNIATVHEIGETDSRRLFIVMPWYEGETIKERVARGPLEVEQAVDVAKQIARGLRAAHRAGIVHRDVKPANVMITTDGLAKILDFGVAKIVGLDLTQTGTTLGTAAYMSPEQATGASVDHRTDLWALGVLLYEMLTGEQPFEADYNQAVLYAVINTDPKPLREKRPDVPEALAEVVESLLQKDPDERIQTAGELLAGLQGQTRGEVAIPGWKPFDLRRNLAITMAALLLVLGAVVWGSLSGRGERGIGAAAIESIAVLPFSNLTGDASREYVAAGIHEALIGELAQIGALRVISRTSTMQYAAGGKTIPVIANELDVDAIVEGSLVSAGEPLGVRLQLWRGRPSEERIWGRQFEANMVDALRLQNDVVRSIAREIGVQLTPGEERRLASARPVDPEAYQDYLQGQYHLLRLTPENYDIAMRYFQSAVERDSTFAPAYTGIAGVWAHRALWGGVLPAETEPEWQAAIARSLELDDTFPQTHVVIATWNYSYMWDWEASEAAFERAIELNPNNANARYFFGDFLLSMKRPDEALRQLRLGLELDPLNPFAHTMIGWGLLASRSLDEALESLRSAVASDSDNSLAIRCLWTLHHLRGNQEEALEMAQRFYASQGNDQIAASLAEGLGNGEYERAYRRAADVAANLAANLDTNLDSTQIDETYFPAMRVARLYTFSGDNERALDYLERAYEERFPSMFSINVDPHWDAVRDHPRFTALLGRMNLEA